MQTTYLRVTVALVAAMTAPLSRRSAPFKQNATEAHERRRRRHERRAPREVPGNLAQEALCRCVPAYSMEVGGPLRPFEMTYDVSLSGMYDRHGRWRRKVKNLY